MKKQTLAACWVALMTPITLVTAESLTVFTWEDYLDPELAALFTEQTGIELEFIYFDNDEARDQIMAETIGYGFDLILVDDVEVSSYVRQNWIAELNRDLLPNLSFHGDVWQDALKTDRTYAVPYGWGTYGLIYHTGRVATPPTHWADLFDPDTSYAGRIQMPPQASELLLISLMAQGLSAQATDKPSLEKAEAAIMAQKPLVGRYKTIDYDADLNLLALGQVDVAVSYNSDALVLMDEYDDLAFVTPAEGTVMWIDLWTLSAQSKKVAEAHQFMNFMLDPEIVARNVEFHYTATFSKQARELLPEEIAQDEVVFPFLNESTGLMAAPTRDSVRTMMKILNRLDIE